MIHRLILAMLCTFLVSGTFVAAQNGAVQESKVGSCEKDGFEIKFTEIESQISGSNAAESLPGAEEASAFVQLTSISPGPMREDKTCTRIKWRGQGGCIKARAQIYLPNMQNEEIDECANYNETVASIREQMVRLIRDRVSGFRQTLGQCETLSDNPLRVSKAQAAALTGDEAKNQSLQRLVDGLLQAAAVRVDRCIPVVSVKEYGSRAYYQFDENEKRSCGLTPDPQMIGINVYAPGNPLMKEVEVLISGGDGVLFPSRGGITATLPGEVGSISGNAQCEARDAPYYATMHPFVLFASEPVYWMGYRASQPSREHVAMLERKCANTRC